MKIQLKAAIFDMDGTLLNTMPYWRTTSLEYALAHQWPIKLSLLERMMSTSSRRLIRAYAEEEGLLLDETGLVPELEAFMNRHYLYDAHVKGHIRDWLEALKRAGVRMGVATGAPREYAKNGLRRLGLIDYFEFVTDNYERPLTKSQPEYFDELVKRLGAEKSECWVFEDALYAVESAKASGLHVCAIEDPSAGKTIEEIRRRADITIADWLELLD